MGHGVYWFPAKELRGLALEGTSGFGGLGLGSTPDTNEPYLLPMNRTSYTIVPESLVCFGRGRL